jgi:DNA gyrase subunit A
LISRCEEKEPPRLSGNQAPLWLLKASSRETVYLVTEEGQCAAIALHTLPLCSRPAEGVPIGEVAPLKDIQRVAAIFSLPPKGERLTDGYLLTVTRQGFVKKSSLEEIGGPAAHLFTLVKVNPGDRLGWVLLTHGDDEILFATAQGMAIRFSEQSVRPTGLATGGVLGIKLRADDEVIGAAVFPKDGEALLVASDGRAKRLPLDQFPVQGRYGQGVQAWKIGSSGRLVGLAVGRSATRVTLFMEKLAPKSIRFDEAPLQSRAGRGKVVQELKADDRVLRLMLTWETAAALPQSSSAAGERRQRKQKATPKDQQSESSSEPSTRPRKSKTTQ